MNRRKLTKESLDELAKRMPLLSEEVQAALIGGGDGSRDNPFSFWEYKDLGELFRTGWVDLPDSISYLTHPYDYYFGGSGSDAGSGSWGGSGFWEGLSGNWEDSGNIGSGISDPEEFKPSCVFNVYDYLDGNEYDACHYYKETLKNLGYEPDYKGGVRTNDIPAIGSYGGFDVKELTPQSNSDIGIGLTTKGITIDGDHVIMTFNDNGIDHAVVVTGLKKEGEVVRVLYYDPTKKENGYRNNGDYVSMYSVRKR